MYELEGLVQLQDAHFWTLCTGTYYGTLRLDVMARTDARRTLSAAKNRLSVYYLTTVCIWESVYAFYM